MASAQITPNNLSLTKPSHLISPVITPLNHQRSEFNSCRMRLSSGVKCCVNLPLKPSSLAGRSLSTVLQNQPESFYDAVSTELNRVAEDRDAAFARSKLSLDSPEASLHRRIAELKAADCQIAVEDVLYMIILQRFSEIRVPLVPSLSECLYNGRLEILPSKDWELESMHNPEVLDMIREHLTVVLGWKAGSSVAVNWSTTKVPRQHLREVYVSSIMFGYFLKSASLRFCLEHNLPPTFQNISFGSWTHSSESGSHSIENVILDQMVAPISMTLSHVSCRPVKKDAKLRCYVTGLDLKTREVCAKLKSEEAAVLSEKHCAALFGDGDARTNDKNEMILTSLSSMKRLVLEAVAFGCFLWDAEQFVSRMYKLKDRY